MGARALQPASWEIFLLKKQRPRRPEECKETWNYLSVSDFQPSGLSDHIADCLYFSSPRRFGGCDTLGGSHPSAEGGKMVHLSCPLRPLSDDNSSVGNSKAARCALLDTNSFGQPAHSSCGFCIQKTATVEFQKCHESFGNLGCCLTSRHGSAILLVKTHERRQSHRKPRTCPGGRDAKTRSW